MNKCITAFQQGTVTLKNGRGRERMLGLCICTPNICVVVQQYCCTTLVCATAMADEGVRAGFIGKGFDRVTSITVDYSHIDEGKKMEM